MRDFLPLLPAGLKGKPYSFVILRANGLAIPANNGGTVNADLRADAGTTLYVVAAIAHVYAAGGTDELDRATLPLVTTKATYGTSAVQLIPQEVPVASIFGSASLPAEWAQPVEVKGNSSLSFELRNYSAAGKDVRMVFHCLKFNL